ncbi:MAG: 4-hydroxy-tetrahydrodipicolinate synthase [Phycisphaerae bacterium]|nr:4-hydroxy-tetrahydrodipicolinate synthase [Phycisphaerae bacterium]
MTTPAIRGGCWAPIFTTFNADESLDLGAFRALADYIICGGVSGLLVTGSNGEAWQLDESERAALYRAAVEVARGRVTVAAGTGWTSTRQAIRFTHIAADAGCDAAFVLEPWFLNATPAQLDRYYTAIADAARLPLLFYHNPVRTHQAWAPEHIGRLAHTLAAKVVGVKDSEQSIDRVRAIRASAPAGFKIYSGSAWQRADFAAAGADGCIDGTVNLLPRECAEAAGGDKAKADYVRRVAKILASGSTAITLMKQALQSMGVPAGQPLRPHDLYDEADLLTLKRELSTGGRLAGGEAGRHVPVAGIGDRKVAHLLKAGLAEQAEATAPLPSQVGSVVHVKAGDEFNYHHHQSIAHFDGKFWAVFSAAHINEDSPGQTSRYATSPDGLTWSSPADVTPRPAGYLRWTAGGLWLRNGKLLTLATRCTRARYVDGEARPGLCWADLATDGFEWTGKTWKPLGLVLDDFYVNEAPRPLGDGRYAMAGVNGPHDPILAIGGQQAVDQWDVHVLSRRAQSGVRLTEPSWWMTPDGDINVLMRDDAGSRRLWLATSRDGGATWSEAAPTDLVDAQSKFHVLPLGDGRVAIVSNATAGPLRRRILTVGVSSDGRTFDRLHKLVADENAIWRIVGMHKARGFSYPHAIVHDGRLWVIHGPNKEDVEVRAVKLSDL